MSIPSQMNSSPSVPAATTTFAVSEVTPAAQPLPVMAYQKAVEEFLFGPVEACSAAAAPLVARVRSHPLVGAVHAAFTTHRPLCLTPDAIWLTLTQGLAHHINANAERLRSQLVAHQGQLKIVVRCDDFIKGAARAGRSSAVGLPIFSPI